MYRSGTKLIWIIVIALTQVIGAIIYLVIGRPEARHQTASRRHATTSATVHDLTAVLGPDQRGC
jgi:hypothetical protein